MLTWSYFAYNSKNMGQYGLDTLKPWAPSDHLKDFQLIYQYIYTILRMILQIYSFTVTSNGGVF